jgi:hypothetical protein
VILIVRKGFLQYRLKSVFVRGVLPRGVWGNFPYAVGDYDGAIGIMHLGVEGSRHPVGAYCNLPLRMNYLEL